MAETGLARLLESAYCLAPWGAARSRPFTRADLAKLHHSLRETPTEANRPPSLISRMLSLAGRWGLAAGCIQLLPACREVPRAAA